MSRVSRVDVEGVEAQAQELWSRVEARWVGERAWVGWVTVPVLIWDSLPLLAQGLPFQGWAFCACGGGGCAAAALLCWLSPVSCGELLG